MTKLHGILPAVVTPFDDSFKFSPPAFERLLDHLYQAGVHGLYVCGQTGEGLIQTAVQRKSVVEVAVRNSPREKLVIVHVGTHGGTAEAIELARHAEKVGAAAISSLPPIGYYSFEEIKLYYSELAASTDLPLLVYYFPSLAPSIVRLEQILQLCEIPNVVGLKFTDSDLFRLAQIKKSGAVIFNGADEMLAAGLLMGADGGIGSFYNVIPGLFVKLYAETTAGRWQQARELQVEINELIAIGLRYPVHPAVKKMLSMSGIDCGRCVAPRRALSQDEEVEIERLIAQSSFAGLRMAPETAL
jgi:N-acetylneuraminate lyase